MNKLELKHIVGYLPYGMQCKLNRLGVFNLDEEYPQQHNHICHISSLQYVDNDWLVEISVNSQKYDYTYGMIGLDEFEPILRPMSDLHKDINGKIHLLELYAMASMGVYDNNFTISEDGVLDDTRNKMRVRWVKDVNKLYIDDYYKGKGGYYTVSIEIIEYLYENHFDIYGLIEQNLAIDINTL